MLDDVVVESRMLLCSENSISISSRLVLLTSLYVILFYLLQQTVTNRGGATSSIMGGYKIVNSRAKRAKKIFVPPPNSYKLGVHELIMHNYAVNRKFKMSAISVCNIWLQRTRRAIH